MLLVEFAQMVVIKIEVCTYMIRHVVGSLEIYLEICLRNAFNGRRPPGINMNPPILTFASANPNI